jgi:hypothetical protein
MAPMLLIRKLWIIYIWWFMTVTKIWILVKQLNVTKPNMELWSIYQWIMFWFAFRKWKMWDPSDDRGDQRVVFFILTFHDFFFFLIYVGCPGQLTRTTTIPHGPLDILQAQEQVRHRGGDRRAHKGSNPGRERNKSHDWPQQLDPQGHFPRF